MRLLSLVLALLVLIAPVFAGTSAQKDTITIYTGGQRGTYHRIGEDIAKACTALNVQVISTDGSAQNLNNLVQEQALLTGARFALVQEDVLRGILGPETRSRQVVSVVMPLYHEQISILVNKRSRINTIFDLNGKKVAVGARGSGIWFTSTAIASSYSISWAAVERSPDEAILALLVGEIDAMILVAGHPFRAYTELPASMATIVKFIDLPFKLGLERYRVSVLEKNMYLWQQENVSTLAVRSLLITASTTSPDIISKLQRCITDSEQELRRWGHPKWKDVTFNSRR